MLQDIVRFSLFGHEIAIHGFGLMLVIGFLLGMYLVKFLAKRSGLDPEVFANAALLALFTGVLGARLSHVLENLSEFTRSDRTVGQNLFEMINISSGGLTYYGGFLLAFPTLVIYAIKKKVPLRLGMDIIAPGLMIGLGLGRVGCFLNGCCYGAECDLPWAVQFPYGSYAYQDEFEHHEVNPSVDLLWQAARGDRLLTAKEIKQGYVVEQDPRDPGRTEKAPIPPSAAASASQLHSRPLHPAQLYSTLTALLLAAALIAYFTMPHTPGMVFAVMMILEGIARFVLEMVRVEPAVTHIGGFGLSLSMVLGILISIGGVILAVTFRGMGGMTRTAPLTPAIA
jgi:phosphatidylglycerol---prolipoprotein diacylglyceryl transferase